MVSIKYPRPPCRKRAWSLPAIIALSTVATGASASEFNAQGVFAFDPAAVFTEGFENFEPGPGMEVVQGDALEGDASLRVQASSQDEDPTPIALAVGSGSAAYVIRAFVRSETSWYPTVKVSYEGTPGISTAYATLFPTGRMTSDGWVEIATAPVSVNGARHPAVELLMSSSDVNLDAIEVVEAPGAYRPNNECSGTFSAGCSAGQVCIHGYCQDGEAMVPPLPDAASRSLFVDVVSQKLRVFFGGVASRKEPMQAALAVLDDLRQADNAWTFWSGIAHAVVALRDAHSRPFGLMNYIAKAGRAFPVCLVEGDADLSHSLVPSDPNLADVLVSHVGPEKNPGLAPGDRIVAIDGQHPVRWAENLVGYAWGVGEANDETSYGLTVELLSSLIPAYATTIDVIRCDAVAGTCTDQETLDVSEFEDDSEETIHPECDNRPAYHLAQDNPDPVLHETDEVRFGLLADSQPDEDLYGMIWNDTMWDYGEQNPWAEAYGTFRTHAKGLILDHRTGNGGTAPGAAYLTELSRSLHTVSVWSLNTTLGLFDEPFSQADGLALFDTWKADPAHAWRVGSSSPREDMRIAVLLARDVSGSDFFPFGVKGSPNTRLFGRKTMGAFSTFTLFETASFLGWSLASGDFISEQGDPQIGRGVEPDEDIVPKQSDLIVGTDTVYERALTWVRCGDGGCE